MLLRRAKKGDQWPVFLLLEDADLPTEGVADHFDTFIVAENASKLVGVAGIEVHGPDALLRSVAVAPEVRGSGLGSALARRALTVARENGLGAVYLLTTTAESFFPRFGFERISRDLVPGRVQESQEFHGACPSSAVAMRVRLEAAVAKDRSQ
jgi:amino-acid N-acetyltransferase